MGIGDTVHGEICPGEWMLYHYLDIAPLVLPDCSLLNATNATNSSAVACNDDAQYSSGRRLAAVSDRVDKVLAGRNVQLRIVKHIGSMNFMTLVGDHPPMRLIPPYRVMQYTDREDEAIFCNLNPAQQYWMAFVGGSSCAVYDLTVFELPANEARCANGDARLESNGELIGGSEQLPLEHFMYGSADPFEYVHYYVPLTVAHDIDANLLFELELRDGLSNPNGATLEVWMGSVPDDLHTEFFADTSSDGIFSVMVNVLEMRHQLCKATGGCYATNSTDGTSTTYAGVSGRRLAAGGSSDESGASGGASSSPDLTFYIGVRASSEPIRFRLLATEITSHAGATWQHGELCPGQFIYHHWENPHGGYASVRFIFNKHIGDANVMVRRAASFTEAPLKLTPPFYELTAEMHDGSIEFCNAEQGEHVFLAISGGHHCMTYEVKAVEIPLDECHEFHGGAPGNGQVTDVDPMHFEYSSCEAHEYVDFSLTLTEADYHYNYLIEVVALDGSCLCGRCARLSV